MKFKKLSFTFAVLAGLMMLSQSTPAFAVPTTTATISGSSVTLTANEAATIYYTTNGNDPTLNPPTEIKASSLTTPFTIPSFLVNLPAVVKFFAASLSGTELWKSVSYDVNGAGTLTSSQTITFTQPASQNFGTTPTLTATASSGLTPTFTSSTTGVCTITSGGALTFGTTGTCTIAADQSGNGSYLSASTVTHSFSVVKGSQTISYTSTAPGSAAVGGTAYNVTATGGASGNTVTFTIDAAASSVCSIAGSTVSFTGNGTCVINANQLGNSSYNAATQVQQSFAVGKGSQTIDTITFTPNTLAYGGTTTANASATSNLAVSFTSTTPSVCSVSGSTVNPVTAGTCTIAADQAGSANYNAASQVTINITVSATAPGAPTAVTAVPGGSKATINFIAPTNNGGSPITGYTVTSNPATGLDSDAGTTGTSHLITGLTNGTSYTFTVTASNSIGTSPASAPSIAVIPNILTTSIGSPSAALAGTSSSITYSVTYIGADAVTLSSGDVTLNKTGSANGSVAVSGSSLTTRTVTISNFSGDGTLGISILSGTASINGGIYALASSASSTFQVDTTIPELTVTTLADGTITSNNTLTVSGTATDANGIQDVTVNGSPVTLTSGAFNTAITLQNGTNSVTVIATDTADNQNTISRSIIYDHTKPTIIFTAPTPAANSAITLQSPTFAGTISEPGSVSIVVNGGTPIPATMNGLNFSAELTLALGTNVIDVKATDRVADGTPNSSTEQRTMVFDNVAPSLAITDPPQDITTTLSSYLIKGTASDTISTAAVAFRLDGVAADPAPTVTNGAFQQSVSLNAARAYAISVTAIDSLGNSTAVQRNIIYHPITIADALRALQISIGTILQTTQDSVLDVAPLASDLPSPDGTIDIGDVVVLLRRAVGLLSW